MLRFAVLGPMLVTYDEKPIDLPTAMLRRLVAILLCQPGLPIPIDLLLEALWEGQPPPSARKTLQIYVHRLRRVLGEGRVLRGPTGYTLSLDNAEVDSLVFADLVRRGNEAASEQASELYRTALGLWRGDAFGDILGCTHVANQARQLDQSRLHALEQYAEIELRLGRHAHLIGWLAPATVANPYLEKLRAQLILALYRSGRQAEALAEYRLLHHQLIEELGVEPGPELRQLHERMLRNDPDLSQGQAQAGSATPAQLPLAPHSFAGRTDELAELDRLLAQTASRDRVTIVALTGPAGVGKTATALSWAHRVTGRFPDGQLYANLRGFDPFAPSAAPTDVLRGFLGALGVPKDRIPGDIEAQTALFRSLLAGRTMLVVLDNVFDAAHVRPLLPGAGRSMVVMTSRNPLTGLVVAEGAHPIALRLLTESESWELMTGRLGGQRITAEPEATGQIVQRCAGLPLALAVIAARAQIGPEVTLAALASGLNNEITLDAFSADDPLTDVRAVLSWSYKALAPLAALVFRLSAVHPGPDIAVETMADLARLSREETEAALRELVEAQLSTLSAPGRHSMHDLLRAYATELFGQMEADEALQARQRLLDHYLHVACDAALALNNRRLPIPMPPRPEWLQGVKFASPTQAGDWFTAELAALDSAFLLAAESGLDSHVWRIGWAIADMRVHEAQEIHRRLGTLDDDLAEKVS